MSKTELSKESVCIPIGGKDYEIEFTMASIHYLAEKYGDVGALFSNLKTGIDAKSIEVISDLVYAGTIVCDDDDNVKGPISAKKIMSKIKFNELGEITEAIVKAFSAAFPEAKENPTKGEENPPSEKNGTGDTSTAPGESS